MNNAELMTLLKKVNENNVQRKYLYVMGGIIVLTSIGLYLLSEKSKDQNSAIKTLHELNNGLIIKTQQQQATLSQKEEHINKVVNDNQALQRTIVAKQNQSST
jgi:hypothetical protein